MTQPALQRCATCGQDWWDAHVCPERISGVHVDALRRALDKTVTFVPDPRDAEIARLRAAASQASFCLRTLLPEDADAQMTVRMLDDALKPNAALTGAQRPQESGR